MTIPVHGGSNGDELESAFRRIEAERASGILRVSSDGVEKRIYFRGGRIVSASSDAEGDELGRRLVDRGKLSDRDLARVSGISAATGRPLAEVLVELGLLGARDIDEAAKELEQAVLDSLLRGPGNNHRFEAREDLDERNTSLRLDLSPTEALGRAGRDSGSTATAWPLESSSLVVRWAKSPPVPFAESTLSTKESALIDFLRAPSNGGLTPSAILERSPLNDEETLQVLSRLISAGILELGAPSDEPEDFSATRSGIEAGFEGRSWPSDYGPSGIPKKLGRFEVERVLGRGSMGSVLLAKDPAIDRVVAIKLIQTAGDLSPAQRDKYRERFYREASSAGQLLHPNIATVFDVGHTEDGTPFIVMEYVKGTTLRELIEQGKLSLPQTFRIARDVLDALAFAHSQGIVHRDVKPSNVMVTPELRAKIMDFGIAHVVGSELTSAEDVLGSPYYMAPEQLSKGVIGPPTDLFAFAVVLYRTLTGRHPFEGDSFAAIAHAILHESPVPPDRHDPSIPKGLAALVLRCLEKSPERRYQSGADVLRALIAAESGRAEEVEGAPYPPKKSSGDRWLALSVALVLGAFLVLRLALPNVDESSNSALPEPTQTGEEIGEAPRTPDEPSQEDADTTAAAEAPPSRPEPSPAPTAPAPRPRTSPARPAQTSGPSETSGNVGRGGHEESPAAAVEPTAPTEAELFYEARRLLETGELERSKETLDALLARDPSFAGAAELYRVVTDQTWERKLPLVLEARHNHRLGSCRGELSLASLGIRFQSDAHDWAFSREEIRVVERPDERTLFVETFEKDMLSFGKNKRYKFDLETPFSDGDWARYQRLLK